MLADAARPAPGVKPAPPIAIVPTPAMPCAAARVRLGDAKTVNVVDAVFPAASVMVICNAWGTVADVTITAAAAGTLPAASDNTVVVFAVVAVLYQVVAVPFNVIESAEDAANPAPVIVTVVPGLTAVAPRETVGTTVKVAVAEAVPAVTVIVCVPATVKVPAAMLVV